MAKSAGERPICLRRQSGRCPVAAIPLDRSLHYDQSAPRERSIHLQPHPVPPLSATPEKQPAPPTADVPSTAQRRRPHFADQLKMDNIGVWDMHLTVYLRSLYTPTTDMKRKQIIDEMLEKEQSYVLFLTTIIEVHS